MKKVLLIDDMLPVVEQAGKLIKERYDFAAWQPGKDPIEQIRREMPDIILLDLYLENDRSYQILTKVTEDPELNHIPVIITGADASVMVQAKAFSLGAADFVRKPFVDHVLFRKIDSMLKLAEIGYKFVM